jgi:zinc transport system permease protein
MILAFTTKAALAGIGIALVTGPLGSVMVWRRMAYFGDTLAHAMLLGVGFSVLLELPLYIGMIGIALCVALLLSFLLKRKTLPTDAMLGIFAHTTLALGLIVTSMLPAARLNLLNYLYGDILATRMTDLYWIIAVDALVLLSLIKIWKSLLMVTIHEELAVVEGLPVGRIKSIFVVLMACVFAMAVQLTGVLLITALLVIPAATARQFSKTPEMMAVLASSFGILSVLGGMGLSLFWDVPTGPAIVVVNALFFVLSLLKR